MTDLNILDPADKEKTQNQLRACADAFGGMNFFLQLLEAIRETKPHPLRAHDCEFNCPRGTIKWSKVIYYDKLVLLMKCRANQGNNGNLLPPKTAKIYKNVMNLVRTIGPIQFTVKPINKQDGKGFTMHSFDVVDKDLTRLNPIFDVLFFCTVNQVKRMLR